MPLVSLAFEQFMQLRYGMVGAVAAALLVFGIKIKSETCQCIAVVLLVLLLF